MIHAHQHRKRNLNPAIRFRTKDQRVFVKEQHGYEGGLNNPMSWDRTVEKFHWLSEAFADEDLRKRLIQVVQQLDARPISDLMDLLTRPGPVHRCLSENSPRHSMTVQCR
jgi:2-methylcitrate dehydratase